jgi:hypothetical protein
MVDPEAHIRVMPARPPRRSAPRSKKLDGTVAEERTKHPELPVELWATDEHRVGLKPILRGVWAPIGNRPIAVGHHRYEWLYVTGFVATGTGEVVWYISTGIDKALSSACLRPSPLRPAPARRAASSSCSTMLAGTHRQISSCRRD